MFTAYLKIFHFSESLKKEDHGLKWILLLPWSKFHAIFCLKVNKSKIVSLCHQFNLLPAVSIC